MRLPSIATISKRLGVPVTTAQAIRRALEECRSSNEGYLHDRVHQALTRIDTMIGGHGVEYIRHKKDSESFRSAHGLDYVNMGDTYKQTVIFNWLTRTFCVCSWGDIVESARGNAYP